MRFKKLPLLYSFAVTLIFAAILSPLHFAFGFIHYNPFLSWTDLFSNFLFSLVVIALTGSPLGALMLLLVLYAIGGLKFYSLRRNIAVGDLQDLQELWQVTPPMYLLLACLCILGAVILVFAIERRGLRTTGDVGWLTVCAIGIACLWIFPAQIFSLVAGKNIENKNRGADFLWGGQLYSIGYDFIEKRSTKKRVIYYSNHFFKNRVTFGDDVIHKKNIHIIVLESYTSLGRLGLEVDGGVEVARAIYQPLGRLTYAIAPVFGGNSAGSEYEILCGNVESYSFGGLTFNAFGREGGSPCLPNLLKIAGYDSFATIGTQAFFFNADKAYSAMGFEKVVSYKDHPKVDVDVDRISDREMFSTNRTNFSLWMRESGKPILNYLVTIAGHDPYYLDEKARPLKIKMLDQAIQQYLNRVAYTTLELNEHLKALKDIDPNCIVFIVGDHLVNEALSHFRLKKIRDDKLNSRMQDYILLEDFVQIDAGNLAYNEVPAVIKKLLSGNGFPGFEKKNPLATNMGYYQRDSLMPIECDDSDTQTPLCRTVNLDIAYHRELGLNIIKPVAAYR